MMITAGEWWLLIVLLLKLLLDRRVILEVVVASHASKRRHHHDVHLTSFLICSPWLFGRLFGRLFRRLSVYSDCLTPSLTPFLSLSFLFLILSLDNIDSCSFGCISCVTFESAITLIDVWRPVHSRDTKCTSINHSFLYCTLPSSLTRQEIYPEHMRKENVDESKDKNRGSMRVKGSHQTASWSSGLRETDSREISRQTSSLFPSFPFVISCIQSDWDCPFHWECVSSWR